MKRQNYDGGVLVILWDGFGEDEAKNRMPSLPNIPRMQVRVIPPSAERVEDFIRSYHGKIITQRSIQPRRRMPKHTNMHCVIM